MITAPYRPEPGRPACVHVFDAQDLPWQDTVEPGLRLKPVRYDDDNGGYFGLVHFAPMMRSGLHQHRGVATSFVLDGGLTDYHGSVGLHQAGINFCGSTHDAISYQNTLLVVRLEAPVLYPPERGELHGLHAGSRHAEFENLTPEVPPEINVSVDALPVLQTGIAGVRRQTVFDYAGTGTDHRFIQSSLMPGSLVPAWRASAPVEVWVRGGIVEIGGHTLHGNCMAVIEPGAKVEMSSRWGALMLVWADGPEAWIDTSAAQQGRAAVPSLFGF